MTLFEKFQKTSREETSRDRVVWSGNQELCFS